MRSPDGVSYVLRATKKPPAKARRPKSLTDRQIRQIVRGAATGDYSASALKAKYGVACSVRAIQRLLAKVDFLVYSKMDRTLPLTKEHKEARLEFAERFSSAAQKQVVWPLIIFSDEKKFNLDGPDGYKHYWRDIRRPPRRYLSRQNGGGSLMVWGAFGVKGKSELVVLEGRQKSSDYIYTISEKMLPFAHAKYGTDNVFMQDNASIHASYETMDFFKEEGVTVLDWPARSPDLNPIENVWAILARKVYGNGKQYVSVAELTVAVQDAWKSVTMQGLHKLLDSMPARCFEVARKNGDKTHY
ncbi:hypothetical protein PR002_g22767 [Phytophthora rubi]|uniref:Tc1-like transposase DDE domain-containing protein n=1 Tax=Phytophthora rubi TaxID=129364 RepID=A0A6A3IT23_9STRA|nr:hypothetical protein PR002_g22767 [Phytophthora rubi]